MKSIINHIALASVCLATTCLSSLRLYADDYAPPTYRGKVILVVDKTMAADSQVAAKIDRLTQDLVGDGWRVLRHDVERGPEVPGNGNPSPNDPLLSAWATQNAPRIREVRALIQADYNSAPNEVKNVFLIGHIPVPYSGTNSGNSGGHYGGAEPADTFYGDMTSPYGVVGWSDSLTAVDPNAPSQCYNLPDDGKFDQNYMPSPMKPGVGRVDLYHMAEFGVNESTLISRYFDKDHDFRCGNFLVQPRALTVAWDGRTDLQSSGDRPAIEEAFQGNVLVDIGNNNHWFPNVSGNGQDYLVGYGGGYWISYYCEGIGALAPLDSPNNFLASDSRVVFVNLYGSYFGNWESSFDFLRAPLANPYDPANGRYGYGLSAVWSDYGLDPVALPKRALGATIGEALYSGFSGVVNNNLMGDPTLRMHTVIPPTGLAISTSVSTASLTWTASTDAGVSGYNIYCAPTQKGPYTLVNSGGPVTGTSYQATRPTSGNPDNYYMVRAVKTETTPVGSYVNMSEGIIAQIPGMLTAYLNIQNGPANANVVANTGDGTANSAAFTVDAMGCDAAGDEQISYQWYKDGVALTVDDCHFTGANTCALLIKGVQTGDAGNYWVVVGNNGGSITSPTAALTVDPALPTAAADTFTVVRNTPTNLNVLANDSAGMPGATLNLVSVSALSDPTAGTITISSDQQTILFTPTRTYLGTLTFTYIVSDGAGSAQATVTVNVIATPGDTPPTVSVISDQQMTQDTTIDVPFTASDNFTTPDDLIYVATCSNPTLIPNGNFSVTGNGTNRVLHIKAGTHQFGSGTVTLSVTDDDGATTTIPTFQVTVIFANIPTLMQAGFLDANTFNFTISDGLANSVVEVKESDDLVTWKSLGTVTLNGNLYNFVDSSAGSSTHRFYSVQAGGVCSANTLGFIQVTVPGNGQALVANQLNNPAGNTVPVLFAGVPVNTTIVTRNSTTQINSEMQYSRHKLGVVEWMGPTLTLNPGEGAFINNPTATPFTVTFVGDVPQGQQVNTDLPTTAGYSSLISSILPLAGDLNTLGFPAVEGDQFQQLEDGGQQMVTTATYTNGNWSPAVPTVAIGESFLVQSGGSTTRPPWTENFSGCP